MQRFVLSAVHAFLLDLHNFLTFILFSLQVKLVKCYVNGVPIDLSSNQVGGLCTLCFLEEVDRRIGHGHLFKRSVILLKSWCYYESRILGSHHALLSTYAITVLLMHTFNIFHEEVDSPLKVLLVGAFFRSVEEAPYADLRS
jgi:hypothetical protein